MVALWQVVLGGVAVALGLAWVVRPTTMSRLQIRLLYFGAVDPADYGNTTGQRIAGRVTGLALAGIGAALALGLLP